MPLLLLLLLLPINNSIGGMLHSSARICSWPFYMCEKYDKNWRCGNKLVHTQTHYRTIYSHNTSSAFPMKTKKHLLHYNFGGLDTNDRLTISNILGPFSKLFIHLTGFINKYLHARTHKYHDAKIKLCYFFQNDFNKFN